MGDAHAAASRGAGIFGTSARRSKGSCVCPFTHRNCRSITPNAAAHQRSFWLLVRQRSTFAVRSSTRAITLSIRSVVRKLTPSSGDTPSRWRVSVVQVQAKSRSS